MSENKVEVSSKDLKEVVSFVIAMGTGIEKSLKEDGQLTISDLPNLFPALFKIMPAIEGLENVPVYIKAMNKEEADEIFEYVKTELELESDQVEGFIEDAVRVILDLWVVLSKYFFKPVSGIQEQPSDLNGETPNTDNPEAVS